MSKVKKDALPAAIKSLMQMAGGVQAVSEWLGNGMIPVNQHEAEYRGATCRKCPRNITDEKSLGTIRKRVASAIKRHVEAKKALRLEVYKEEALGMCGVCGCWMPLKIWVPSSIVKKRTKDFSKYPVDCWLRS